MPIIHGNLQNVIPWARKCISGAKSKIMWSFIVKLNILTSKGLVPDFQCKHGVNRVSNSMEWLHTWEDIILYRSIIFNYICHPIQKKFIQKEVPVKKTLWEDVNTRKAPRRDPFCYYTGIMPCLFEREELNT